MKVLPHSGDTLTRRKFPQREVSSGSRSVAPISLAKPTQAGVAAGLSAVTGPELWGDGCGFVGVVDVEPPEDDGGVAGAV